MKKKKKKKKSKLSEFIRYTRGEMTKREENAFQRELQKDPFAEDAAEGLSQISAEEAVSDLHILEKRLKTRVSGRQKIMYYRIAASVAVLMIISSVFLIINNNKPGGELAETGTMQLPLEVPESEVINEHEETLARDLTTEAEKRVVKAPEPIVVQEVTEEVKDEVQIAAGAAKSENLALPAAKEPELFVAEAQVADVAPVAAIKKTALSEVRGTIISSEDNLPIPGAVIGLKGTNTRVLTDIEGKFRIPMADTARPILIADFIGMETREFQVKDNADLQISLYPSALALSEVVVIVYGGAKSSKEAASGTAYKADYEQTGYSSPQPVTGKADFDKFIEENIQNPAILPSGQRAVVVLSFIVRSTGNLDSIKVVRSPGSDFSEEAIRLIKAGPGWKPAEENGRTIDDEVRARIVFK